jgi:glycosyltransferase involved in cell wall biosynthesis
MKSVTVIVPCWNVEKYLPACFESLLKQTCSDFDILAVDDGSPDRCAEIMDEYAARYPERIFTLHKENGGYGSALSAALKQIGTPYFLVCDPDDTLVHTAVDKLLSRMKLASADMVIGAKYLVYEDSADRDYDAAYNTAFVTLKSDSVYRKDTPEFNDLFFVDPSPHAKLYRTDAARNLRFPEKVGYTDNLLFYLTLLRAKSVIYTEEALANYLINRTGNSMQDVSCKAMNGEIKVFKSIMSQSAYISGVPDIFYYRMFEAFKYMLYKTRRMNCTPEEYAETLDYLETFLQKLTPYGRKIRKYYLMYTKNGIVERVRDDCLMNGKLEKKAYADMKRKMCASFGEADA